MVQCRASPVVFAHLLMVRAALLSAPKQ